MDYSQAGSGGGSNSSGWLREWLLTDHEAGTEGGYEEVEMVDFSDEQHEDGASGGGGGHIVVVPPKRKTRRICFLWITTMAMIAVGVFLLAGNNKTNQQDHIKTQQENIQNDSNDEDEIITQQENDNNNVDEDEGKLSSSSSSMPNLANAINATVLDLCPTQYLQWMKYDSVETVCQYYRYAGENWILDDVLYLEAGSVADLIDMESDDVDFYHDLFDPEEWKGWVYKDSDVFYSGRVVGAKYCRHHSFDLLNWEQLGAFCDQFTVNEHNEHIMVTDLSHMLDGSSEDDNNKDPVGDRGIVYDGCHEKTVHWLEAYTVDHICAIEHIAHNEGYRGAVNLCTGLLAPQRLPEGAFEQSQKEKMKVCSSGFDELRGETSPDKMRDPVGMALCDNKGLADLTHEEWYFLCIQRTKAERAGSPTTLECDYDDMFAESCASKPLQWLSEDAWHDICKFEDQYKGWEDSGTSWLCDRNVYQGVDGQNFQIRQSVYEELCQGKPNVVPTDSQPGAAVPLCQGRTFSSLQNEEWWPLCSSHAANDEINMDLCPEQKSLWISRGTYDEVCALQEVYFDANREGALDLCGHHSYVRHVLNPPTFAELCGEDVYSSVFHWRQGRVEVKICANKQIPTLSHEEWYSLCGFYDD